MRHLFFQTISVAALACALAAPAFAESQARIVRLSDVQGAVQINKNSGLGFESAFLNLPLTTGSQLRTKQNGRAEIEFEDGSTLRITPNTTIEFSTLENNETGKRISSLNLVEGRAYVNWLGKSGDQLTLNFSREKIALGSAAHFRVAASSDSAEVASFKNDLKVDAPSGTVKVEKKKLVAFDADQNGQPTAARKFEQDTYDKWDKEAVSYHEEYSQNNSTPYGYGFSDLNYYGTFNYVPGYGPMWQPFFAGAGWNPYMDGAWSFYPGMGYFWASAYPWGWMPYYYGNWTYVSGLGWGWQPGGFQGWHGGVHVVGTPGLQVTMPKGTESTVIVGRGGPALTQTIATRTVINNGTAALGVARGSIAGLHQLSAQATKTGSVAIHSSSQFAATSTHAAGYAYASDLSEGRSSGGSHVGSAPASHASSSASVHR